jgi:hypothetical protein
VFIGARTFPYAIAALLFVSCASRSMHFASLGTFPFADVPADVQAQRRRSASLLAVGRSTHRLNVPLAFSSSGTRHSACGESRPFWQ